MDGSLSLCTTVHRPAVMLTSAAGRTPEPDNTQEVSNPTLVSEGGLPPDSLGSSPVHLIVYKVEPPVCVVSPAYPDELRLLGTLDGPTASP